ADALILEVGLGGRLDATNVIETSQVGVITPVSMDHMEFLGDSVPKIAAEKAGIARSGVPLVCHQTDPEAAKTIEAFARRVGAHPIMSGPHFSAEQVGTDILYKDGKGTLTLPMPALPGAFQSANAALAVAALRHQTHWSVPDSAFSAGLRWATWPARLQQLSSGTLVDMLPDGSALWLDGGHNQAAGMQVATFLKSVKEEHTGPVHVVLGMLSNKALSDYLRPFKGLLDGLWALPIPGHEHHDPAAIAAFGQELGVPGRMSADVGSALVQIAEETETGAAPQIFVLGSLYLAGDVLARNGTPPE
ncbi:MAG: bifunctional folylpolyglutamate synthase/dihydrofolate synthase, partial [Pseudomonadota bacterium]